MSPPSRFIKPGEPVGLRLMAAERAFLVDEMPTIGDVLIQRIKGAPPDKIKVPFTLEELTAMAGHIVSAAAGSDTTKQKRLNAINRKVQHILNTYSDDEAEAWSHARATMNQAGINFNPFNMLKAELKAMGVDVDAAAMGEPVGGSPEASAAEPLSEEARDMLAKLDALRERMESEIQRWKTQASPQSHRQLGEE